MDKSSRQASILDGHSPVNRYELLCVEKMARGESGPDEERMMVAFEAFDALIPGLGVYTRIFKKLRDDLFDAVYSDDLTTYGGGIVKIPYFTHITRRQTHQSAKLDELEDQLDTVKKRLFEKHKQLEATQQQCAEQKQTIDKLNHTIEDLNNTVADMSKEIERLETTLKKETKNWESAKSQMEQDIQDLNDTVSEYKNEIKFLSKYKKGYDDLYYAFLDNPEREESRSEKRKPVVSTKRANLMTNINLAQKLEEQIMTVLNTAVEEFDRFMEEHKAELQSLDITDDMTDAEFEAQEIDIDNADQQLEAVQERFKNTIGDISNELLLLKQHSTMLMEQLQILEENHPTIMRKNNKLKVVDPVLNKSGEPVLTRAQERRIKKIHEESKKTQDMILENPFASNVQVKDFLDSILSAGLGGDEEDEDDSDPFIPQERVFSKYAAMLYTSNNQGRSFEEFKDAKYCVSCGEKTTICPHKLPGSEKVFSLPLHCTHIKIVRPKVKINKDLIQELMKPQSPEMSFDLPGGITKYDRDQSSLRGQQTDSMHSPTSQDSPSVLGSDTHMPYTLNRLFDDYKERTMLERNIARPLTQERCLSMIEQFWTYVIWQDDNGQEDEIHYSIMDKLYRYLEERYMVKDIMYLCCHDFLTAIVDYADTDKTIQLLGNILAGNFEGSSFRYMMLMCDFVWVVEWKEVEDFRAFASVVYPFLGEDDLETLQMSYTSFSENKVSKGMVAQFIIHLILKYREPRFLDMENKLIPFQSGESSQPAMSLKEFTDAMDNILPLTLDKLRRRLYFEAEKMLRKEGLSNNVPIMRLSQIASYLGLLQITYVVRETLNAKILEWRHRPSSSGSARVVTEHESQILHGDETLITMSRVKLLSANITRRLKLRQQRYDAIETGSDW